MTSWEFYSCLREENVREIFQRGNTIQLKLCRSKSSRWSRNEEGREASRQCLMEEEACTGFQEALPTSVSRAGTYEAGSVRLCGGVATPCLSRQQLEVTKEFEDSEWHSFYKKELAYIHCTKWYSNKNFIQECHAISQWATFFRVHFADKWQLQTIDPDAGAAQWERTPSVWRNGREVDSSGPGVWLWGRRIVPTFLQFQATSSKSWLGQHEEQWLKFTKRKGWRRGWKRTRLQGGCPLPACEVTCSTLRGIVNSGRLRIRQLLQKPSSVSLIAAEAESLGVWPL